MFIGARLCLLRPLFSDPRCVEFCFRGRSASSQGPFGKARRQASTHVDTHADARACRPAHFHTCSLVHARSGRRGHILHTGPRCAHCAKQQLQMEYAHTAPHRRAYLVTSLLMHCPGQNTSFPTEQRMSQVLRAQHRERTLGAQTREGWLSRMTPRLQHFHIKMLHL